MVFSQKCSKKPCHSAIKTAILERQVQWTQPYFFDPLVTNFGHIASGFLHDRMFIIKTLVALRESDVNSYPKINRIKPLPGGST